MAETVIPRIGLTTSQWNTYKAELFKKEANPTAGFQSIGGAGNRYIGGYQISDSALETAGYLRSKSAGPIPGFAWKNDQNWLKPNGDPITPGIRNYQDFLNNPRAQDDALLKLTQTNARSLTNYGIINENTPVSQRAGELAAAHLLGPAGRNEKGIDGVDGFNTPARKYYNDIGKAVGGGQTNPPPPTNAAGAAATAGRTAAGQGGSSASSSSSARAGSAVSNSNNAISRAATPTVASQSGTDSTATPILISNPLEPFQLVNYLFTFSSLTSDAVNFPTTSYLKGNFGRIIFSSAGRYSENRERTAYRNPDNPSGKYDFFIDNVVMQHLVVPTVDIGSTNLVNIDFEVTEPYSVGQFLQSCQLAAHANGHYSYVDSPFLLTLEFKGYIDNTVTDIKNTIRYIPVRIRSVTVSMTSGGTVYKVSAIAWTDQAFDDQYNILKQDSVISGKDVLDILQTGERSLQTIVNTRLKEIATENKGKAYIPDEIAIVFPKFNDNTAPPQPENGGATVVSSGPSNIVTTIGSRNATGSIIQTATTVNLIGTAKFNFTAASGGDIPKHPDTPTVIKEFINNKYARNSFNNDYTQREFTFRKGTSIVNAITEIMLMSGYCENILKNITNSDGTYNWFRIESQVYMLTPNDKNESAGVTPKLLVYRIVPYKVHMSKFQSPDITVKGYKQLANEAVKEYNYIYTGKNVDVLDFKLNLNVNFASNTLADGVGAFAGSPLLAALGKTGAAFNKDSTAYIIDPQVAAAGQGQGDTAIGIAKNRTLSAINYQTSDGAGLADNYRALVARIFQDRMLNGEAEMVSANMTILGDPYYISFSGLGNYSNSNPAAKNNLTDAGSLDYQKGEVDILFNFLTPVDLSSTGKLLFDKDIDTILKIPFSGLYFIRQVTSTFSKGKFTQEVSIVRRPNQKPDNSINNRLANPNAAPPAETKANGAAIGPSPETVYAFNAAPGIVSDQITEFDPVATSYA
jgi:hypothetical protein